MAWTGVVTNAGNNIFRQWAAGGTLQISGASAGDGTIEDLSLFAATAISNEKQQLSITSYKQVEGGVRYGVQFVAAEEAYTARQVGIWASLDGGEKTLIAIYQSMNGLPVESAAAMPDYVYEFGAIVEMDNTGELQVNIDTSALVSRKDLQEAIANVKITIDDTVTSDGANAVSGAAVHAFAGGGIPTPTAADSGKALVVGEDGTYALGANYTSGTEDLTAGTSPLEGVYYCYE